MRCLKPEVPDYKLTADLIAAADEAESIAAATGWYQKRTIFFGKSKSIFSLAYKSLKPSTTQENQDGIDWWVIFKRNNHFPLLGGELYPHKLKVHHTKLRISG